MKKWIARLIVTATFGTVLALLVWAGIRLVQIAVRDPRSLLLAIGFLVVGALAFTLIGLGVRWALENVRSRD